MVAVQGGAVSFEELEGSPAYQLGRDSREVRRKGRVLWSSLDALLLECLPSAPALPGAYPGVSYLYCDTIAIVPENPEESGNRMICTGDVASYSGYATVEIGYKTLPYDPADLLTRKYSFGGEFMTLPANSVRWEGDAVGKHVQEEEISAARIIPTVEHSINFHRVTSIPWAAIRANIGCVNDGTFEGASDQTLLFMGAEISFTFSTNGVQTWTLEYKFQERRVKVGASTYGWNHFYRPTTKTWVRLLDDAGNPVYPLSANFGDLW